MSYEKDNIENFGTEFDKFSLFWENWNSSSNPNFDYLWQFNTKLRMAFGMSEILLDGDIATNTEFLNRKTGSLKELHLFQYKLMDLWFAYEALFKLYEKLKETNISNYKIVWLDKSTYNHFLTDSITNALTHANERFVNDFNSNFNHEALKSYITHCKQYATGSCEPTRKGQKGRLCRVIDNIDNQLTITDVLTITYAIRNNYVHNGETTITNAGLDNVDFSFNETQKLKLIQICYDFLSILTVNIANTLIGQHN